MYYTDTDAYFNASLLHILFLLICAGLVTASIVIVILRVRKKVLKKKYVLPLILIICAVISGAVSQTIFSQPRCCGEGYTYIISIQQIV